MKNIILLLAIVTLFSSCEKVINIDLNTVNPQYVIEGTLHEGTNPFQVKVALTTDYYGRAPQQKVEDAVVMLINPAGDTTVLPYAGNGLYELPAYTALAHNTYQLKVVADGNMFEAASTIPGTVTLDSISYEYQSDGFQDPGYEVAARFTDPANQKNYYRLLLTVNDTFQNEARDLAIFDDKYNDGRQVRADFFKRFEKSDKITISLLTIDAAMYNYFVTLRDVVSNQDGPAPANPNTNFTGGALGYFGAFSRSTLSTVIEE